MIVLGFAGLASSSVLVGWRIGLGFAIGAAIGLLNFYWLKKVVAGIGELAGRSESRVSTGGIIIRFLFRYFLMAIAAFVILTVSRESLYGLFAGLFLPVAAILCETVYEVYVVLSRRERSS